MNEGWIIIYLFVCFFPSSLISLLFYSSILPILIPFFAASLHTYVITYLLTYLLTHSLTHSIEQSPSWEANWFVASQEIPSILLNPNAHCRTHQWPTRDPVLSHPDPVHTPTSHYLKIHFNIILPSTSCFILSFIPVLLLVFCFYFSFLLFNLLQIYYVCLSPCLPIFICCSVSFLIWLSFSFPSPLPDI